MPRLVTQAVSEQPVIALVGAASPLRSFLQSFFERHDFVVQVFSSEGEVKKNTQTVTFYKVVVIDGWSSQTAQTNYHELLAQVIALAAQTKTLFMIQEHTSLTLDEVTYQQKNFRYQLETQLPSANLILVQDAIIDKESATWWQALTREITSHILIDQVTPLYPISQSSLQTELQQLLVKPQSNLRLLLRGKEQLSTAVAAEVNRQYQLYHQQTLVLKQQPESKLDTTVEEYYQVKQLAIEPLPTLLQGWIQTLPAKGVSKPTKLPTPVKPTKPPQSKPPLRLAALPKPPSAKVVRSAIPSIQVPTPVPVNQPVQAVPIDEQLNKLFSSRRTEQKVTNIQQKVSVTKKITKKNKKKSVLFLGGLGLAGAALGVLALTTVFWLNQTILRGALIEQLQHPEQAAPALLNNAKKTLQLQTEAYELFLPDPFFDAAHDVLSLTEEWQSARDHVQDLDKAQTTITQVVLGKEPLLDIPATDQTAFEELSRLSSRLSTEAKESTDKKEQQALEDYLTYLEAKRSSFLTFQQLAPLFPRLLGQETKRSYAILLQNEQELRPTGGFLQAVAVVTLDKGQIIDTQVFSVYDLDAKLAAVVTPPDDLKQVLGEQRWYLRDSNWNPDFPSSAQQIAWFLEQQLNKKVDGVIAMNLSVTQDLLRTLGPLEIEEFNELLTDKNLQERMEFHSEVKLVESDKSIDYAATVLEALLVKITQVSSDKTADLLDTLGQQLAEKNILVSMLDSNEATSFTLLGWSGELVKPNCPAQLAAENCVVDTLAVIDSNVGVNKANYHLKRNESHTITLSPTLVQHKHLITLENTSNSNAWPKGAYQSYLRVILDPKATLSRILINEKQLSAKDIKVSSVGSFTAVGFLTDTPIQAKSTIVVEYSLPVELGSGDSYTFFAQKQAGISQPLSSVAINLGPTFKPSVIAPQADVVDGTILFNEMPKGHVFVGVSAK